MHTEELPEDLSLLYAHLDCEAQPREARALLPVEVDLAATRRRHRLLRALAWSGWPLAMLGAAVLAASQLPPAGPVLPPVYFGTGLLVACLGAFMVFLFGMLRDTERRRLDFPHAGTLAVTDEHLVLFGFASHQVFARAQLSNLHLLIRRANDQFAYGELHFEDGGSRVELPLMSLVGEERVREFAQAISGGKHTATSSQEAREGSA